jgi:hypothetical protein
VLTRRTLAIAAAAFIGSCGDAHSVVPQLADRANGLAVSATHQCALRSAGVYCWGANTHGQLGDGTTDDAPRPVLARSAGEDVVELATSNARTCVRRASGRIACWGAVTGEIALAGAVQLAIDEATTCVLRDNGDVACGRDTLGLTTIAGMRDIVELRGGVIDTYCGRTAAGSVHCIRTNDRGVWSAAIEVTALAGARAIAVSGYNEVCAIAEAGNVLCHDLDNGKTVALAESEGSVALIGTSLVACAQHLSGDWTCWNILPPMLETIGSPPIRVPAERTLVEVAAGGFNVCAVQEDERVVCANAGEVPPQLHAIDDLPP